MCSSHSFPACLSLMKIGESNFHTKLISMGLVHLLSVSLEELSNFQYDVNTCSRLLNLLLVIHGLKLSICQY